jgi:hypothetical protein
VVILREVPCEERAPARRDVRHDGSCAEQSDSGELEIISKDWEGRNRTAIFVVQTILGELLGFRAKQIGFSDDPVAMDDLISSLERLCDEPAGWQLMQKKAGY